VFPCSVYLFEFQFEFEFISRVAWATEIVSVCRMFVCLLRVCCPLPKDMNICRRMYGKMRFNYFNFESANRKWLSRAQHGHRGPRTMVGLNAN